MFINRTMASPFSQVLDSTSMINDTLGIRKSHSTRSEVSNLVWGESHSASLRLSPNAAPEYMMQLLCSFRSLYLPAGGQPSPISGRTPASWIELLASSTLGGLTYNTSLTALCTAQLGMLNKDQVALNESVRIYALALRELRSSIKAGVQEDPEAVLASIAMLSTYEVGVLANRYVIC